MSDFLDRLFELIARLVDRFVKNEKLNGIFKKILSREVVMYLICGFLATAVNFIAYILFYKLFTTLGFFGDKVNVHIANVIAWVVAVVFAFFTNKLLVFESKSFKREVVLREFSTFTAARIFSFVVEEGGLFIFNTWLGFNAVVVKIAVAIVVIIMNYVFSKMLIFKK